MLKYNGGRPRAEVILFSMLMCNICQLLFDLLDFFLPLLLDLLIFCLQTKLKSAVQLQDLLDATRMLVPRTRYFTLHKLQYVIHISITCNSISISHQGLIKFWMCGWSGTVSFLLNITFD